MAKVGVIVGRFQVDTPHAGHHSLIEQVHKKHGKVLICLGCSPTRLSAEDPLDYPTRSRMMQTVFPWATIVPIEDMALDEKWSVQLDEIINKTFPTDDAILYGSRDSFFGHYSGKWPVVELETVTVPSGTELQRQIAENIRDSNDFRAGVIYACSNRYPISYQTIDVAILVPASKNKELEILLCRKPHEKKLRFIGGFVSVADKSLEQTVRREVHEEAHAEISDVCYLASRRIADWRFKHTDQILTSFFIATLVYGVPPRPDDDIAALEKVPVNRLLSVITPEHKELAEILINHLNSKQKGSTV